MSLSDVVKGQKCETKSGLWGEPNSIDHFLGSPRIQTCHVTYHKSKSFQTNYFQRINQLLQLSLGGFNSHMAHCLLTSKNTNGISQPLLQPQFFNYNLYYLVFVEGIRNFNNSIMALILC